jgi:trans-feruloyl-CoA hydratase/vanillin synthase
MAYQTLLIDIQDGIAKITLNRPEKKNAYSPQMADEFAAALEDLRYDDSAKVLVITGAGDAFCAGMDLKELFYGLKRSNPKEYDRISRVVTSSRGRTLRYYPKPTIAMVNGFCFGGAFPIVECCDLAVAADEATFGLSEINFGMFPGGQVSRSIANILRPREALLYALTGRAFDGKEAARIGFVNFSVPLSQLESTTYALAREMTGKDAAALRATKDAYRFALEMSWESAMSYASAKEHEVSTAQGGGWVERGVGDFVKGSYRPGLESHQGVKG